MANYITPLGNRVTRETWLNLFLNGGYKAKPPQSWLETQLRLNGRSLSAAAAIWHRNYDRARQYAIWDQASVEDFVRAGYADASLLADNTPLYRETNAQS